MGLKFERKLKCEASSPFDSLIAVGKDDDEKLWEISLWYPQQKTISTKSKYFNCDPNSVIPAILISKKEKRKINITIHNNLTRASHITYHKITISNPSQINKRTKEKI